MRKIGLARLETDLCSQEGKSLPIHEYAIMVAIVATKDTLRRCGGLECRSNLDGGSVPTPPARSG